MTGGAKARRPKRKPRASEALALRRPETETTAQPSDASEPLSGYIRVGGVLFVGAGARKMRGLPTMEEQESDAENDE